MSRFQPHRWIGPTSLVLVLAACESESAGPVGSTPAEPAPNVGRVALEVEFARNVPFLTIHWRSLLIDRDGTVVLHDRSELEWSPCAPHSQVAWGACSDPVYGASAIDARLGAGRVVGHVAPEELETRLEAVRQVAEAGPFRSPNVACNDTGVFTYVVYRFDSGADTYRATPLRLEGEIMRQNVAAGARDTAVWLRERMMELDPDVMGWVWSRAIRNECVPDGLTG